MKIFDRIQRGCAVLVATLILCSTPPVSAETPPADKNEVIDSNARYVWNLIDVIEKHHVDAPTRQQLIAIVARTLADSPEMPRNDFEARLSECRSVDQFVSVFRSEWNESWWKLYVTPSKFRELAFAGFGERLGPMRVVPAKDYAVEEQLQNNRYVGLGVNVGIHDRLPQFTRIMPGGAAERAALTDGTIVLRIDGRDTENIPMPELINVLRGPQGSQVTLTVNENGRVHDVTLTRSVVRVDSVFSMTGAVSKGGFRLVLAEPVGYLRVDGMSGSTLHELRDAEVRLKAESIKALILDFRSTLHSENFHHARQLADGLLDGGPIWKLEERGLDPKTEYADRDCLFRNMPLVIIVGPNTGAAHTAVAAALQDAGRAIIIGDVPRFDGMISTATPLPDSDQMIVMPSAKLTRSRTDRRWPLQPDHSISMADRRVVLSDTSRREQLIRQLTERAERPESPQQLTFKRFGAPASALAPGNVTPPAPFDGIGGNRPDIIKARQVALQLLNGQIEANGRRESD